MFYILLLNSQDIVSGLVCAAVFFALAVPMAVYLGEWIGFKNLVVVVANLYDIDPVSVVNLFNLNAIIPSTGATSVSSVL